MNFTEQYLYDNIHTLRQISFPERLIEAGLIILGLWVLSKLIWMCVYQYRYGDGAGYDYLEYGKKYVVEKYKK